MDFPKPSTYVPLARRFTDEKARELEETRLLYQFVKGYHDTWPFTPNDLVCAVHAFPLAPDHILVPFAWAMKLMIEGEKYIWELPEPSIDRMDLKAFVEFRNLLHAKEHFYKNEKAMWELLREGMIRIFGGISDELPLTADPSPFTIPLVNTITQPGVFIDKLYGTIVDDRYQDYGIFKDVGDQLYRNLCAVSGREPYTDSNKPWKNASDSKDPPEELVDRYLGGSPFADLLKAPVPLKLTYEDRFNHTHIIGGTGAGKTTLIKNLILHDLESPDPPSLVIVDPHGDLIRELTHSDLGIADRLVIIDPRDIEYPPALNVFAINRERLATYDEATKEQITAGVIQTFDYLFSGLIGADLTAKQGVFFRYVARLMLAFPEALGRNATILDMLKLMSDDTPYRPAMESLPEIPAEFFKHDFNSKTFQQTKEQIRYRLQAIIENPTLARLFTAPDTKVDIFSELNRGSIILVDTAKDFLKDGSSTFGRIFISLTLQAVLERAAIPEQDRKPTFLIVDEAASYFDSNIDDLLTEARKYKCGLTLAHQYLDQATNQLRASLAANTGIKFAGGLSSGDARSMAPDMRTTADFILGQPRHQFAAYIKHTTPHAVSIPVSLPTHHPQLSAGEYAELIARNRERVWIPPAIAAPATSRPGEPQNAPQSPAVDEDISESW